MAVYLDQSTVATRAKVRSTALSSFAEWQAQFQVDIANFEGFISLEIVSPSLGSEWVVVQHFDSPENLQTWLQSDVRKQLMERIKPALEEGNEVKDAKADMNEGITEIYVTQVNKDKENAYREWLGKIHQAEAKFPGFRRVHVQSPSNPAGGGNWITFLQFDTRENLERWINSQERQDILKEAETMIKSLESHRLISPFSGWFSDRSLSSSVPSVWQQTMLILLVLFPIVMLEFKFLNPLTARLNPSLGTFIGNAISVALVSWPMLPMVIPSLDWWWNPQSANRQRNLITGTLLVIFLYLLEILVFWNLL